MECGMPVVYMRVQMIFLFSFSIISLFFLCLSVLAFFFLPEYFKYLCGCTSGFNVCHICFFRIIIYFQFSLVTHSRLTEYVLLKLFCAVCFGCVSRNKSVFCKFWCWLEVFCDKFMFFFV